MKLYVIFILIIIILYFIYIMYREYNKSKMIDEKILFWLGITILFTPVVIYYIDILDFPSHIGLLRNDETGKWFDFITSYVSSIIGALIGAITLVLMTIHEFKVIKENDNEQMRINNLPLIEYNLTIFDKYNETTFIDLVKKQSKYLFVKLHLKNIGMNVIRKCNIKISSNTINNDRYYAIDDQGIIEKNCEKIIVFKIPITKNKNEIRFTIRYQDVLFNWYEQEVDICLNKIEFYKDDRRYADSVTADIDKVVKDEKMLEQNKIVKNKNDELYQK